MAAPRKYPDEVRERAIRMVIDAKSNSATRPGACTRIGTQLGINVDTLPGWVTQAEVDANDWPGITTSGSHSLAELERENKGAAQGERDLAQRVGVFRGGARVRGVTNASSVRIRLARTTTGEAEVQAVREVLESGVLTNGPRTTAFEQRFATRHDAAYAVAFANGTVALAGMFLALGIGPGDEVVVPSMTFISTATSVLHVGATPVFADVDVRTFNLDPQDVRRRLTPRTKAVLAVHYAGQPADVDALQTVCDTAGVVLLEDAAQAVGARWQGRSAGSLARMAMFSFTPTKNITTGEGGMVTTDDADLAGSLRLLRNHGQTALYRHDVLGWNWRLTEMQSAIGVVQLGRLDDLLERKRANVAWMNARLAPVPGITPPYVDPRAEPVHMLYTCLLDERRDDVLAGMIDAGIEARVYFPPAHRQAVFVDTGLRLPVTEELATRMISLPMHARLTERELSEIAETVERLVVTR